MDKNKPKASEFTNTDEEFLRQLLASVHAAVVTRGKSGAFGELTLKITQEAGRIRAAKILEEAIVKPGD